MAFLLLWCEGDSGKEKELGDGYILVAFQLVKSLDYTKGFKNKSKTKPKKKKGKENKRRKGIIVVCEL